MQTIRLYVDVARCRSFSQAAERHGVTQSAASQRIGQLERRLGVTLIDRSVRPLELTEPGRIFLSGCEDILERYDRLERKVAAVAVGEGEAAELEGVVRVEAIYSAGIDLLSHVRERFEAQYPRLRVQIRYDRPEGVYRAVREGRCDLGILSYPQRWAKVGIIGLRDETMAVVCQPNHALAHRKTLQAADLAGCEMAAFEADLPVSRAIRQYLREQDARLGPGGGTVGPKIANEFDNIDTIKAAVAVTDQVAILPKRTVIREVAAGTLAMVELEPRLARPLGIIYRPHGRQRKDVDVLTPAVQAFADFLVDHAGPEADTSDREAIQISGKELVGARA